MKILFICAAGYSMGLLADNVEEEAKRRGMKDFEQKFLPYTIITDFSILKNYDAIVFAPQARHKVKFFQGKLEELDHNVPTMIVGYREFGFADGKTVLEQILSLFKK